MNKSRLIKFEEKRKDFFEQLKVNKKNFRRKKDFKMDNIHSVWVWEVAQFIKWLRIIVSVCWIGLGGRLRPSPKIPSHGRTINSLQLKSGKSQKADFASICFPFQLSLSPSISLSPCTYHFFLIFFFHFLTLFFSLSSSPPHALFFLKF